MFVALNYLLVVLSFSCILSAPFSQRARVALTWGLVPLLWAFTASTVVSDFDLVKHLSFYKSFHSDWRNQVVHVIFVPLIVFTAFVWAAYVPSPFGKGSLFANGPMNFWQFMAACAYAVHFVHASPEVGSFVALLTFAQAAVAYAIVDRERKSGAKGVAASRWGSAAKVAGFLHILAWYMQLHPGHAVFEGRKPALLDGLVQAFMDAPLFVWFEVAFALGYNPPLEQQLEYAVKQQHLAWAAA